MEGIQIDWLAVGIAAFLNMVIGYFWYSKWLFGKEWVHLSGRPMKVKHPRLSLVYGFLTSLLIAFFLSFFEAHLGVTTVSDGMFVGFCLWLGFVATTQISSVIWGEAPFQLFLIQTGYKLLTFLVMGGIIGA